MTTDRTTSVLVAGARTPMGRLLGSAMAGPFGKSPDIAPMRLSFRPRTAGDIPVPAGIPAGKVRPVAFAPGAKFGNYLGGLVNRVEGVNYLLRSGATTP